MHDSNETPSTHASATQAEHNNVRMTGPDFARRHALLKGLGRGSAIVAAVTPIKTLALTQSATQNGKMCTLSGVGSAVHSSSTALPTCGGLSPGWYKTPSHWPFYDSTNNKSSFPVGSKRINEKFGDGILGGDAQKDTAFNAIFSGGSSNGMFYIMLNEESTDEFHWIAALLNAVYYASGGWPKAPYVYPYSAAEILKLYTDNNATGLAFIKSYMETL